MSLCSETDAESHQGKKSGYDSISQTKAYISAAEWETSAERAIDGMKQRPFWLARYPYNGAMAKKNKSRKIVGDALIARNKRATFDYKVDEKFEAGLVLQGWEVKSLREGRVQLVDGYVQLVRGEAWLYGANINPLNSTSSHYVAENTRRRKLLLNRRELSRLIGAVERKGYTIVAMSMYWKNGKAKIEIGIGKGKKEFDKRATIKDRDWQRDKARVVRTH